MVYVVCAVLGYLLGCFPTGFLVGKHQNIDIRKHGSGNIGTTNALRVMGLRAAAVTFIGDSLKCILALTVAFYLGQRFGVNVRVLEVFTTLFVILGHDYPAPLKFKGGKGIAATAGFLLFFDYRMMLIELVIFLLILIFTRYVSLGSLCVSVLLPIGLAVFYPKVPGFWIMFGISVIICLLAFLRHKDNIRRLLAGTENKFGEHAKD